MKRFLSILLMVIVIFTLTIVPSFAADKEDVTIQLSATSGMTYNYGEGQITFHIQLSSIGTPSGQIEIQTVAKKPKTIGKVSISGSSMDYTVDVIGTNFTGGAMSFQAKYKGDDSFNSATSNSVNLQINPKQLTVSLKKTTATYTGEAVIPELSVSGLLDGDDASIVTMSYMDNSLNKVKEMVAADTYTVTLGTSDKRYTIPFSDCTVMFTIERGVCPFVDYYKEADVTEGEEIVKTRTEGTEPITFNYGDQNKNLVVTVPNGVGSFSVKAVKEDDSTILVEKTSENTVTIEAPKSAGEYQLIFTFDEGTGYLAGDFTLPLTVNKRPCDVTITKLEKKGCSATVSGILEGDYVLAEVRYYDEDGKESEKVPTKKGVYTARVVLNGVNGNDYTYSETSTYEIPYLVEKSSMTLYIIAGFGLIIVVGLILYCMKKDKKEEKAVKKGVKKETK